MATSVKGNETREEANWEDLDPGLQAVFGLVFEREGIDFRSYRRKTIERRVVSRLQKLRCQSCEDYVAILARDVAESRRLLEHVTIKVSRFFRDAPVYERLRTEVLPELFRPGEAQAALHFWSAGCGLGEEAYSLALLLAEVARRGRSLPKVAILATDLDEAALAGARRGRYPEAALAEASSQTIAGYFSRSEGRLGPQYEIHDPIRRSVTFLRHDLLTGTAPIEGTKFDLILCRNVLIYFERPAQDRVFHLLAASVTAGGYLCLGEAEHLPTHLAPDFEVIDRQARLYRKL
ncbi:MAG: protein-glutamate O-methyltransferase CheR [Chloroflexi bacterium]|nr:protein-glutamate O-methyltransferase CheR [Chloroflexota bacterium]